MTIDQLTALRIAERRMTGHAEPEAAAEHAGTASPAQQERKPRLDIVRMSDVVERPIDWLWERWLAKGELHIIGGLGEIGKGTIMAEIAAQLSTGKGTMPDRSAAPADAKRSLFLLSEDNPETVFKPRLRVHGAKMDNIFHLNAVMIPDESTEDEHAMMFDLAYHLPILEDAVVERGLDVLCIDALTDALPSSNRNSEGEVRDRLVPLAKMAQRTGIAVMGVMHPGKGNQDLRAFQRLIGASAFTNVARCVWLVCDSPDDDGRKLLGVDKSNLGFKPKTLAWSRDEDQPIVWHGETEHIMKDVFGSTSAKPRDDAEGWLRERLKDGRVASKQLEAEAKALGVSWRTVRRAKDTIGITPSHTGFGTDQEWFWELPLDGHYYSKNGHLGRHEWLTPP